MIYMDLWCFSSKVNQQLPAWLGRGLQPGQAPPTISRWPTGFIQSGYENDQPQRWFLYFLTCLTLNKYPMVNYLT